jgi:hypothetical protein
MKVLMGCAITLLLIAVGTYVFLDLGFFSFRADQTPSKFEQKHAMEPRRLDQTPRARHKKPNPSDRRELA